MGADIHLYAEKYDDKLEKWLPADCYVHNEWHYKYPEDGEPEFTTSWPGMSDGRNYTLIASPKGLPADVSGYVSKKSDSWNGDGHSHSYFTLAELQKYVQDNPSPDVLSLIEEVKTLSRMNEYYQFKPEQAHYFRIVFWFDN